MQYKVERCGWTSVRPLIESYHYLHSMPSGILACFVLLKEDGISPVGAAVFCNGRIQYDGKFLEFSRLWLEDSCTKNSESFFAGTCLRLLQKEFSSFEGVVTWADPKQGHKGTIYKALNFQFDGMSRSVDKFYDQVTHKEIYGRSYSGQAGVILKSKDAPKLRFIYYFNAKKREELREITRDKQENAINGNNSAL